MDVQSQLLFIGSSADMNRNYGGRTRKGSRTGFDSSTPEGVLSRPTATGGDWEFTHKTIPQKK